MSPQPQPQPPIGHEGAQLVASSWEIQQRIYETSDEILNWWPLTKDANRIFLAGLATAALPFVADLSRTLWQINPSRYVNFDLQSIVKGNRQKRISDWVHTWLRNIDYHYPSYPSERGAETIVAVDTILDTGETLIEAFNQFRPRPVGSVVLFCKSQEALKLVVKETGCPVLYAWHTWEMSKHWLYGYGTDDYTNDHSARGCPHMWATCPDPEHPEQFVYRRMGGIERPESELVALRKGVA